MCASHLVIADYSEEWPTMFETEKDLLKGMLGEHAHTIEHIGSTAVPGLGAKPVIDIMIGVISLQDADLYCIQPIQALGYEYVQAFEEFMPLRRYFRKEDAQGTRTHQIHLWQLDNPDYERHLVFRDYLRTHAEEAAAYERLKRELITQFTDGNQYASAKTAFVKACEARAFAWKAGLSLPKDDGK